MQPEKQNNPQEYSKQIDESIANAEERRKQALEEDPSLSDEQLEDVSGGMPIDSIIDPICSASTMGFISTE